jgi:3-hydroxyacyl-CoA dehydrogenase
MGSGIAEVGAWLRLSVLLRDVTQEALRRAGKGLREILKGGSKRERCRQ